MSNLFAATGMTIAALAAGEDIAAVLLVLTGFLVAQIAAVYFGAASAAVVPTLVGRDRPVGMEIGVGAPAPPALVLGSTINN